MGLFDDLFGLGGRDDDDEQVESDGGFFSLGFGRAFGLIDDDEPERGEWDAPRISPWQRPAADDRFKQPEELDRHPDEDKVVLRGWRGKDVDPNKKPSDRWYDWGANSPLGNLFGRR